MGSCINKILDKSTHSRESSSLDAEGKETTKEKDRAEALNHNFITLRPKLPNQLETRSDDDSLKHVVF